MPTPRYTAESILMVRLGTEYIYQPEVARSAATPSQLIPFDRDQIFKSEAAILGSADLHREVIQAIGIATLFPQLLNLPWWRIALIRLHHAIRDTLAFFGLVYVETLTDAQREQQLMARAVALFDNQFDITLEKESAIITIRFAHADAALANRTLETILTHYFEKRKTLYRDSRVPLALAQWEAKKQAMAQAEQALTDFKQAHHIIALDAQRSSLLALRDQWQTQAMVIHHPGIQEKVTEIEAKLTDLDAQAQQLKQLEHEAGIAENAYALAAQNLDDARSYEDRQLQHANSVRVIQQPETPAYPKKWQKPILLAGAVVALLVTWMTAAFTEFSRYAPRNRRASDAEGATRTDPIDGAVTLRDPDHGTHRFEPNVLNALGL